MLLQGEVLAERFPDSSDNQITATKLVFLKNKNK